MWFLWFLCILFHFTSIENKEEIAMGWLLELATLVMLVISVGKPRDAPTLIGRTGEELKMQGAFSHKHLQSALYASALGSWGLKKG